MNNKAKVLSYLLAHGSVTTLEAIQKLHTTELRKWVSDLRAKGIPINDEWIEVLKADGSKARVKRYFLPHEVAELLRKHGDVVNV